MVGASRSWAASLHARVEAKSRPVAESASNLPDSTRQVTYTTGNPADRGSIGSWNGAPAVGKRFGIGDLGIGLIPGLRYIRLEAAEWVVVEY